MILSFTVGLETGDIFLVRVVGVFVLLAFLVISIWVLIDFIRIIAGVYKDGSGNKITEWT